MKKGWSSEVLFMGDKCSHCKKEFKKNDQFVLIGKYPWTSKRYFLGGFLWYRMGYLGVMYHKDCFYEKITKPDKKKKRRAKSKKEIKEPLKIELK
jgi:hypothetical protein